MEFDARTTRRNRRGRGGGDRESPESSSSDSNPSSTVVDSFGSGRIEDYGLHLEGSDSCGGPYKEKLSSIGIKSEHGAKVTRLEADRREEGKEEVEDEDEDEGGTVLDPEKHSFSAALRECQSRNFRSKERRRWPASFDFSSQAYHVPISSPGSYIACDNMKKNGSLSTGSSTFPSPGAPIYRQSLRAVGGTKGWSSERVPLPTNHVRRYGSGSLVLPFGNGRALPSKWEDAEKWILSPFSGDAVGLRNAPARSHYRRPKSKSGPLGSPASSGVYSIPSPLSQGFGCRRMQHYPPNSPLMTGILMADHACCSSDVVGRRGGGVGDGEIRSGSGQSDQCIVWSANMNVWSELDSSSSLPSSRDEKNDSRKDTPTTSLPIISTKDVATQMSPECSPNSSPSKRPYLSSSPSHVTEEAQISLLDSEVRDVQVDVPVTVTRWSKKQVSRGLDRDPASIRNCKKTTVSESIRSDWESLDIVKCISNLNSEEAKIIAWENLQKAKAEEAIHRLEMKLEKKRSASMDKILNKLKSTERKAQEMRNTKLTNRQSREDNKATGQVTVTRRTGKIGSITSCFSCHVS